MEEEEPTGYVQYEKFLKVTLNIIVNNLNTRNDEEELFRAFLVSSALTIIQL
jgi:hypothetical protein